MNIVCIKQPKMLKAEVGERFQIDSLDEVVLPSNLISHGIEHSRIRADYKDLLSDMPEYFQLEENMVDQILSKPKGERRNEIGKMMDNHIGADTQKVEDKPKKIRLLDPVDFEGIAFDYQIRRLIDAINKLIQD